ncbi:MAG: efflux RND transporter periplasmic adaptor subunit [Bryobacter sp.]|nr:efflux RND transporter periplasmic adaptor subunit [Bryobacter sp.]
MKIPSPWIAATFSLLWLAACGKEHAAAPAAKPKEKVKVSAFRLAPQEVATQSEATGTVTAKTSAQIAARTMGYVRELRVALGDRVKQGQVLAVLEASEAASGAQQARAMKQEVESVLPEAESAIAAAEAQLELAQVTQRRMKELLDKKSATAQEFDQANTQLKSAAAQVSLAKAKRGQLGARLAQADQAIRQANIQVGYATVVAPFSGVVAAKHLEAGSLATPGQPLLTLERDGAYQLEASVDQGSLAKFKVGQATEVVLDGLAAPLAGRVTEVVPTIDAATRSGTVKISLPAVAGLRSGLFGRARFAGEARRVLLLPKTAIRETGQLASAFVVEDGIARLRMVTLGAAIGTQLEVLSGLAEGENVVNPVPPMLEDAQPVEVQQ